MGKEEKKKKKNRTHQSGVPDMLQISPQRMEVHCSPFKKSVKVHY